MDVTTTSFNPYNSAQYKSNEFYTISLSLFAAALLLSFIMWRWHRMRMDINRAIIEFNATQNAINIQQMRDDEQKLLKGDPPPPYSSIVNSHSLPNYCTILMQDRNSK